MNEDLVEVSAEQQDTPVEDTPWDPEDSGLIQHARQELAIVGEEDDVVEWYISVIKKFAEFGHSGASAEYTTRVLERLLRYQHLTPINSDPQYWREAAEGVWQSTRNPEYFSNDGGQTFYSLSELEAAQNAKKNIDRRNQARMASARGLAKRNKRKKR